MNQSRSNSPRGSSAFLGPGRDGIITESIDHDGKPHGKRVTPCPSPRGGPDGEYSCQRGSTASLRGQSMSPREEMQMSAAAASSYLAPEAHQEKSSCMYMGENRTVTVGDSSWCDRFKPKDPDGKAKRSAAAQMAVDALAEWDAPSPTASEDTEENDTTNSSYNYYDGSGQLPAMDTSTPEEDADRKSASAEHAASLSRELSGCCSASTTKEATPRPKPGEVIYQPSAANVDAAAEGPHASAVYEQEIPDDCLFLEACSAPPAFDGVALRHFPPPVGDTAPASPPPTGGAMDESAVLLSEGSLKRNAVATPPAQTDAEKVSAGAAAKNDASRRNNTPVAPPPSPPKGRFAAPKPKEKKGCCI